MSREYDAFEDENFGKRTCEPIVWADTWMRVYMEKLAKKWPANMAAVAARKAREAEQSREVAA